MTTRSGVLSRMRLAALAAVPATMMALTPMESAVAGAVLQNGQSWLGVNDAGHLNFFDPIINLNGGTDFYGIGRLGLGDATSPGCLCEGWGVAVTLNLSDGSTSRIAGYANEDSGGAFGLDPDGIFGSTPSAATSIVNLSGDDTGGGGGDFGIDAIAPGDNPDIEVSHRYAPAIAPDTFIGHVTITNNTDTRIDDVVYRRVMDWDVPPTEFDEFVTHSGVEANLVANGGNVLQANDNGFASADPRDFPFSINSETENVDFVDNGPDDHGSVFDFAFGSLDPGQSRSFDIFYGTAPFETAALNALALVGADVYSLGQSNTAEGPSEGTPATFFFGFRGVGGIEPGTTPEVPLFPTDIEPGTSGAPPVFVFDEPTPGRWFDPPFVDGFAYSLSDPTAVFTQVGVPDATFGFGPLQLVVGGIVVAILNPGDLFDFDCAINDCSLVDLDAVNSFRIEGIDPRIDAADPAFVTLFPTFLDFTGGTGGGTALRLLMAGLVDVEPLVDAPAPATLLLLLPAVGLIAVRRRRSRLV
jgi:hypothetical protein